MKFSVKKRTFFFLLFILTISCADDVVIGENCDILWYQDNDDDGFGNSDVVQQACSKPQGFVENNTDCDDTDPTISSTIVWYEDLDQDGLGNPNSTLESCTQPSGYVSNANDDDDQTRAPQIIIDFQTHFFNQIWYIYEQGNEFVFPPTILVSDGAGNIESAELPLIGTTTLFSGEIDYSVSPTDDTVLEITSGIFSIVYPFWTADGPIKITEITDNTMSMVITLDSGVENFFTWTKKEAFMELCGNQPDRIFEAEWLVANDDFTKDALINDSLRLISTIDAFGTPLNVSGVFGNPNYPEGYTSVETAFFDLNDGCFTMFGGLPAEFVASGNDIFFDDIFDVIGDELKLYDLDGNTYSLDIID